MSSSQPSAQSEMFPDAIPDMVVRIWKAIDRWFSTGTHKPPTRKELLNYFAEDEQISERTLSRAYKRWRGLLPWPVQRGQRPPWCTQPQMMSGLKLARPDLGIDLSELNLPPDPEVLFMLVDPPPGGRIRAVNKAVCDLSGYTEAELLGAMYEPMLRHGEPTALSWKPDLLKVADEVREKAPIAEHRWDTYWITKSHQRVNLRIQMSWDASTNCYALRLHVIPASLSALHLGPASLAAASLVATSCLTHHRAIFSSINHIFNAVRGLSNLS